MPAKKRRRANESHEDICSESEEELEIDARVWRLRACVNGSPMPNVCMWGNSVKASQISALIDASRKFFKQAQQSSFWVPASLKTPATILEQFALGVFWFHMERLGWSRSAVARLGQAAGAEYWVQRRTSRQHRSERGVNWHFDKDEDLLDECDVTIQPLVATATYLTSSGAPLVALSKPTLATGFQDAGLLPVGNSPAKLYVVNPAIGRHVAFSGKLLHGVPPELETRHGERLSVLVNVWLHHHPLGMDRFPKRSGANPVSGSHKALFHPSAQEALGNIKAGSEDFPVDWGPWRISGFRIQRDLIAQGGWTINQSRGQVAFSLRKKKAVTSRKRPAAAMD